MRSLAGVVLLAIGWCASGCGGDSQTGNQRGGSNAEAHNFLRRLGAIACAGAASCCGAATPFDEAACLRDPGPVLPFGFSKFRDTSHYTFDATEAERCLDAFQAAMTKCHDPASQADVDYHCSLVFLGDVPDLGSCLWSGDCAYTPDAVSTCVYFDDTEPYGTCRGAGPRMPWTGVEGEPCLATCVRDNVGANCPVAGAVDPPLAGCFIEDGLFCNGTCQRLPGAGQPCEGTRCTPDAYCDGGTCKLRGSGACETSTECLSLVCREGSCFSRAPLGSPCESSSDCESDLCAAGVCETALYPTSSECAVYPAD